MAEQTKYEAGRQELFSLMRQEHGVTCMESELTDIEQCVLSYALFHAEGEAGWRSGYPEYDGDGGVCHIPLDGHPDFMVVAFNSDGNLVDGCGDDVGYGLEDVERWQPVGSHPAPQVAVPEDRK